MACVPLVALAAILSPAADPASLVDVSGQFFISASVPGWHISRCLCWLPVNLGIDLYCLFSAGFVPVGEVITILVGSCLVCCLRCAAFCFCFCYVCRGCCFLLASSIRKPAPRLHISSAPWLPSGCFRVFHCCFSVGFPLSAA